MCGIIGIIRTNTQGTNHQFEKFLKVLFLTDQIRGPHSTGLFAAPGNGNGDVLMLKKALNASDFIEMKAVDSVISKALDYRYLIGHNRFATKGLVTNRNSHPFNCEHITLVHNGTISTFGKFYSEVGDAVVDSAGITYLMAKHGMDTFLKEISGSYALVWHDAKDDSLNVIRNEERPLEVAEMPFGFAIASESWMLRAAADYSKFEIDKEYSILPYHHYQIKPQIIKGKNNISTIELSIDKTNYTESLKKKWSGGGGGYGYHYNGKEYNNIHNMNNHRYEAPNVVPTTGIKEGEIIEFEFNRFDPYKANESNGYGSLYGWFFSPKNIKYGVVAYNCPKELTDYCDEILEPYTLMGRVTNIHERTRHDDLTLRMIYFTVEDLTIEQTEDDVVHVITARNPKDRRTGEPDVEITMVSRKPKKPILALPHKDKEEIFYYGWVDESGKHEAVNYLTWERISRNGCCMCDNKVSPYVFSEDGDRIIVEGDAVLDSTNTLWCADCITSAGVVIS